MGRAALIVGGGTGTRMNSLIPKQFIRIGRKPVIIWSLDAFHAFDPAMKLVLVLHEGMMEEWMDLISEYPEYQIVHTVTGGKDRYHSVKNGLGHIDDGEIVGIHDAVRPLVSGETIKRCYSAAAKYGSAVPVIDPGESVRIYEEEENYPLDRQKVRLVQTPQVFRAGALKEAYRAPYRKAFTDDATVYEALHGGVHLVEGNRENIKITYPADLEFAGFQLGKKDKRVSD